MELWVIKKTFSFDAAHFLKDYDGKCANMHGHTWHGEVCLNCEEVGADGMVVDFGVVKNMIDGLVAMLDHKIINAVLPEINPTCENIAKWFYGEIESRMELFNFYNRVGIERITIQETDGNACDYYGNI
jgi:6-pyruvoyltetrahydropterin/6-carboxytetrahydropterin synthase